jgi:hypothetical protein
VTNVSHHQLAVSDFHADAPSSRLHDLVHRDPSPWLQLSLAVAALSAIGNVVSLTHVERYYGAEPEVFIDQAIAQDLVNLAVVAPLMVLLAWLALRGSLTAFLVWLGFVGFTVYNYVIYAFSIHFGPLFLVWVAVLGGSIYALIGGLASIDMNAVANTMQWRRHRLAAGFLIVTAVLFAMLWLSDIVPALQSGSAPKGVVDLGLPTNPVHVLDLAVFLPAVAVTGVALWARRPIGYVATPALLTLLGLTGLPVLATVFVAAARDAEPAWALLGPIGLLSLVSFALAWATSRVPRT